STAQILDAHVGIDVEPQRLERARRAPARAFPVDEAEAPRISQREAGVLGHGHPIDEPEVLVDEGNLLAPQRASDVAPMEAYAPRVERMNTGQDLDQRRLAGAVLAKQRHDLAGLDREADIGKRLGAAELLGNAMHGEQDLACGGGRSGPGCGRDCRARLSSHCRSLRCCAEGIVHVLGVAPAVERYARDFLGNTNAPSPARIMSRRAPRGAAWPRCSELMPSATMISGSGALCPDLRAR